MSRASGLTPAPMGSNCGWAIPCGRYSSAKAESESPRHAQGSQGRWQPGFQSHLTMAGRLPMSSQPLLEQSPNFPCLLNACFTLSFAQGSQWPRRVGGGCRTSAPRQDSAPWWKADASHHMGLASPRGKLSTSRYRSHVLLPGSGAPGRSLGGRARRGDQCCKACLAGTHWPVSAQAECLEGAELPRVGRHATGSQGSRLEPVHACDPVLSFSRPQVHCKRRGPLTP